MERYLSAYLDRWEQTHGGASPGVSTLEEKVAALYPGDWLDARQSELAKAAAAARGEPGAVQRVAFVGAGLDFLRRLVAACEACLELARADATEGRSATRAELVQWLRSEPNRAKAERAVRKRGELLDWVAQHRDGFWITAMWFDYQRLVRGGRLGEWMDPLAEALS